MLVRQCGSSAGLHDLHGTFVRGGSGGGGVAPCVDLDRPRCLRGRSLHDRRRCGGWGGRGPTGEPGRHPRDEVPISGIDDVEAKLQAQQRRVLVRRGAAGVAGGAVVDETYDDVAHGVGVAQELTTKHQRARRVPPRGGRCGIAREDLLERTRDRRHGPAPEGLGGDQIVRRSKRATERVDDGIRIVVGGGRQLGEYLLDLVALPRLERHAQRVAVRSVPVAPSEHEVDDLLELGHVELLLLLLLIILFLVTPDSLAAVELLPLPRDVLSDGGVHQPFHVRLVPRRGAQHVEVIVAAIEGEAQCLSGLLEVEEDPRR
mmetsp:Transcript_31663/g.76645  ORF Transcript_31663/g.76645 Transcript_31663/m.76645 type:complete len:317 (+) Transcript_31663:2452-3402(+)